RRGEPRHTRRGAQIGEARGEVRARAHGVVEAARHEAPGGGGQEGELAGEADGGGLVAVPDPPGGGHGREVAGGSDSYWMVRSSFASSPGSGDPSSGRSPHILASGRRRSRRRRGRDPVAAVDRALDHLPLAEQASGEVPGVSSVSTTGALPGFRLGA